MKSITAVIPAYNEAGNIGATIKETLLYVDEVLVIDDCSQDNTISEAESAGARVLRQPYNQGYIAAIKRGFAEANGNIIVTLDADGEIPVEQIPNLLQPLLDNIADMVQGHRNEIPRLSERILTRLANLEYP